MTITGALVLFAVIWFILLFIALQIGITTQDEAGDIVEGTPAGAPHRLDLGRRLLWVTVATIVLWIPIVLVIRSGVISIEAIDFFDRYHPPSR